MAQWYLSEPFQAEAIYKQLAGMDYTYVVGMDIGDGESMVYLFDREKGEIDRMKINYGGDSKLPTMIALVQGKPVIGKPAVNYPYFIQNFKIMPARWTDPALVLHGKTYTYRHLMLLYISTLWKAIIHEDSRGGKLQQALHDKKLLIAVGCPSSPDWTCKEAVHTYQRLITEATGCHDVAILAESTAAIMSAVLDLNELAGQGGPSIKLNQGIAVIDAGSSTIDFTYVLLGKKLITRSLDVAGHILDRQLLAVAVAHSGLDMADIPQEQVQEILVMLRGMKESYYPDGVGQGMKFIPLWGKNSQGQVDKDVDSGKYLKFAFNKQFVEEAVSRADIQRGMLSEPRSWKDHCDKFIRDCSTLISKDEQGKLLCDKVILTGGTSFVTELLESAKKVYGSDRVSASPNRDASVARGLCHAKALELQGQKQVAAYKTSIEKVAQTHYGELLTSLSLYLSEIVCDDLLQTVQELSAKADPVTAGTLLDTMNKKVRVDPRVVGKDCEQKVQELFGTHFLNAQQNRYDKDGKLAESGLMEAVNNVSKSIYGTKLSYVPEIPVLTEPGLKEMIGNLNLSTVIGSAWINSIIPRMWFSAATGACTFLGLVCLDFPPLAPLAPVFFGLGLVLGISSIQEKVAKFVMKNKTKISPRLLKQIQGKLQSSDDCQQIILLCAEKTVKTMRKAGVLEKEFKSCITGHGEASLGKVLFLVYDEQPDMK